MSKVKDNLILQGLSGKIGNKIVFKLRRNGLTYASLLPDRTHVVSTKEQNKMRNNFANAVAFAKSIMKDPGKSSQYKVKKHSSLYHTAIADYLSLNKTKKTISNQIQLSDAFIAKQNLNTRQLKAIQVLKKKGLITNSDYQRINDVSKPTATRDLKQLVTRKILKSSGIRGAGSFYKIIGSD